MKIFSDTIIVDWYDGPTMSIGKIATDNHQWVLSNLVYVDFATSIKIFILIDVNKEWVKNIKNELVEKPKGEVTGYSIVKKKEYENLKKQIKAIFLQYDGRVRLLKESFDLNQAISEIREVGLSYLIYFDSIDEVMEQGSESSEKWLHSF